MLRLLLLRYLPRRLVPLLVLWEVVQLVRRLRSGRPLFGDEPGDDRIDAWNDERVIDDRVIDGQATRVPPRTVDRPT